VSEPDEVAQGAEELVPGVWYWHVHDGRIDFVSCAYAVATPEGAVLIDPLPLADEPFARLGKVAAIVLDAGSHQRSAWRLRRELGAPVYAPALSRELDEEPDGRYGDGDDLPGGLHAVFTPGAGTTQHTLLLPGPPAVAFVPDLLLRPPGAELALIPDEYAYDPAGARASATALLDLDFEVLCLAHGEPVTENAKAALRAALNA
jgi:hypothetical protein